MVFVKLLNRFYGNIRKKCRDKFSKGQRCVESMPLGLLTKF